MTNSDKADAELAAKFREYDELQHQARSQGLEFCEVCLKPIDDCFCDARNDLKRTPPLENAP